MSTLSPLAPGAPPRVLLVSSDDASHTELRRKLHESGLLPASEADATVAIVDLGPSGQIPALSLPMVALVGPEVRAKELLGDGVAAVLPRDAAPERIAAAAWAVGCGLVVVDASLADRMSTDRRSADPISAVTAPTEEGEPLTPREGEVLALIADGLSNRSIAKALGISAHTAKFHVNSLLSKLDVGTRTEAVVQAARRGLLQL